MGRVIRDERDDPLKSRLNTDAAVAAERARLDGQDAPAARVLRPYTRLPLNTGDPASSSGVKIDMTELADDVIAFILANGGSGTGLRFQDYTPALNQVVFILPLPPGPVVLFFVNDVPYYPPSSFAVAGQVVTWGNAFKLDGADKVRIYY